MKKLLNDKQKEIENLKGNATNNNNSSKTQELYEKIKKLKDKIEKIQSEAEETKRTLIMKSEKDDKYIEALKQEIEKLKKKPTISQKNSLKN